MSSMVCYTYLWLETQTRLDYYIANNVVFSSLTPRSTVLFKIRNISLLEVRDISPVAAGVANDVCTIIRNPYNNFLGYTQ